MKIKYKKLNLGMKIILEWVKKNSRILDLGCGEGDLLSILINEKQVNGHGIDIDGKAIQMCVRKGLSVSQEDLDTGLSDYPDKTFDYVILNNSIQQVKKPNFVLREASRVGEKMIVSFPNFTNYHARFQIFFRGKVPVTSSLPYKWYDSPNLHFLSINDFIEYCKKNEMIIEDSFFIRNNKRVKIFTNFFTEMGFFLIKS
jgi:methionine biosynthesis protein MetW